MYRLLVAEDEDIERRSLVQIISESPLEINEICSARNGQEAIDCYIRYKPDIVVIDINMPVVNGLDAIRKIRELADVCPAFIVLTSYDYFSYAQQAIRLGVQDFLLKPANREVIIASISKSLDAIRKEKSNLHQTNALLNKMQNLMPLLRDDCLQAILSNQSEVQIMKAFFNIHFIVKSGFCVILKEKQLQALDQEKMMNEFADLGYLCIFGHRNEHLILFVLNSDYITLGDEAYIRTILEHYNLFRFPMGIGSIQHNAGSLYISYLQATANVMMRLPSTFHLYVSDQPKQSQNQHKNDVMLWSKRILDAFDQQDQEKLRTVLHELSLQLIPQHSEQINQEINTLLQKLATNIKENYHVDLKKEDIRRVLIQEQDKYQNLEVALIYMINGLLEPVKKQRSQNTSHLVKSALTFIRANFRNPISLNDLSVHLKVSPFYISKLLNRECGKPFTDIVNEYRIEEAKRFIKQGHMIKEIASEVGFQSSSYFTKTFKKYVGMAATEYRDMFLK